MKLHTLLIVGFAFVLVGCAEKEQAAPEVAEEAPAPPPVTEAPPMEKRDEAFIKHMHRHADQLDDLNIALAEGDIVAAMTPAYWLSRHDEVEGIPAEWRPFLVGMRDASIEVEKSSDLESARAAAEKITAQCQGCHTAAGVAAE